MMRAASLPACLAALLATCACSDVTTNLVDEHKAAIAAPGQGKDASTAPVADAAAPHAPALCGDHACACDDGKDNDGDALIDGLNPECTGPLDDDESTFATGQPNKGGGKCRDCFWDSNAGSGDDGCNYANACLQGLAPGPGDKCTCDVSDTVQAELPGAHAERLRLLWLLRRDARGRHGGQHSARRQLLARQARRHHGMSALPAEQRVPQCLRRVRAVPGTHERRFARLVHHAGNRSEARVRMR